MAQLNDNNFSISYGGIHIDNSGESYDSSANGNKFTFNGCEIQPYCVNDELWFFASDICNVIEVTKPRQCVQQHVEKEDQKKWCELKEYISEPLPKNQQPHQILINENGLLDIVSGSRKPIAKKFRKFLNKSIIQLRKNIANELKTTIMKKNEEIKDLQTKLTQKSQHNEEIEKFKSFKGNMEWEDLLKLTIDYSKGFEKKKRKQESTMMNVIRSTLSKPKSNYCVQCKETQNLEKDHVIELQLVISAISTEINNAKMHQILLIKNMINSRENTQTLCRGCNMKKRWFWTNKRKGADTTNIDYKPNKQKYENVIQKLITITIPSMNIEKSEQYFLIHVLNRIHSKLVFFINISDNCFNDFFYIE